MSWEYVVIAVLSGLCIALIMILIKNLNENVSIMEAYVRDVAELFVMNEEFFIAGIKLYDELESRVYNFDDVIARLELTDNEMIKMISEFKKLRTEVGEDDECD